VGSLSRTVQLTSNTFCPQSETNSQEEAVTKKKLLPNKGRTLRHGYHATGGLTHLPIRAVPVETTIKLVTQEQRSNPDAPVIRSSRRPRGA
jgi:hypothetical protein